MRAVQSSGKNRRRGHGAYFTIQLLFKIEILLAETPILNGITMDAFLKMFNLWVETGSYKNLFQQKMRVEYAKV